MWIGLCLLTLSACVEDLGARADASQTVDAQVDAASTDARPEDARPADAARDMRAVDEDATPEDAAPVDAGPQDAAPQDATVDATPADATPADATPDAAPDATACTPTGPEQCGGGDEDCDGRLDEGFPVGAVCTAGLGACAAVGIVACDDAGGAVCLASAGAPTPETCDGTDEDCDGVIDEAIPAVPCYDGPPNTRDVGLCRGGERRCIDGQQARCLGQVVPATEVCDGRDDDCDGVVDDTCLPCGNGRLDPGEACDDGNRRPGDGCRADCTLEGGQPLIAGVQRDIALATLAQRGWRQCHVSTYDRAGQPLADLLRACAGTELFIGCRATGAAVLLVGAEGRFEEVTRDVGNGIGAAHTHNNVDFYFSNDASWGFAPGRGGVNRNTCDVTDEPAPDRMCWHTTGGQLRGGWRCGSNVRLNASPAFERMIFTRNQIPLGPLRAFGHHGDCDDFNACIDAQTCADAACQHEGHGPALSWREAGCTDVPGLDCDLFTRLPDDLDTEWAPVCNIPVAYDVVCTGG